MSKQRPEAVEQGFFAALLEADAEALAQLLAEDFLLIDVMTGSEVRKAALLEVIKARQLRFDEISLKECRVRQYGPTAVITGRTEMKGSFGGEPFEASSRYTHVFVEQGEDWRLVSAQGTQIATAPEAP
jgi:ketosteroid isomerase-like protein